MYNLPEKPVDDLLDAAKILQAKLTESPFWLLIKDEPPVMNFVNALLEFEKELPKGADEKDS